MQKMISQEEAVQIILANTAPIDPQRISIENAYHTILREEINAPTDLPEFDHSAMDGFAVSTTHLNQKYKILEEIRAGTPPQFKIDSHTCSRIFTGAMIPEGATQIIPQEWVEIVNDEILILQNPSESFIRKKGSHAAQNSRLLTSGTPLQSLELALLASLGIIHPLVSSPLSIAHFTSGDEVIPPDQKPALGQIRNSNQILIKSLLQNFRKTSLLQNHLPENEALSLEILHQSLPENFNLLLISGGASVGKHDYSQSILKKIGFQILFQTIDLRPGKPLVFGVRGKQIAFVIPGNPVSHFAIFYRFLKPAIEQLLGKTPSNNEYEGILIEKPITQHPRSTLYPACAVQSESGFQLKALSWQNSGDLVGLLGCNALMKIPSGKDAINIGDKVKFILCYE